MIVEWAPEARTDLDRLYDFLSRHDLDAADAVFDMLIAAPDALLDFPRMGSRLTEFEPREVREFRVDRYLLRYELTETAILVARLFHAREDRF